MRVSVPVGWFELVDSAITVAVVLAPVQQFKFEMVLPTPQLAPLFLNLSMMSSPNGENPKWASVTPMANS
jgi:hypothetical protein